MILITYSHCACHVTTVRHGPKITNTPRGGVKSLWPPPTAPPPEAIFCARKIASLELLWYNMDTMPGPPPQPTALKVVKGNPGKRALPKNEPKPKAADIATMPKGLTREAKKYWPPVAKILSDANVLTEMDTVSLTMYCEAHARWVKCNNRIAREGMITTTATGNIMQHPAVVIGNKAFDQMRQILIEFGMTPASRTKVQTVAPKKEKSDWDEFE